MCRPDDRTELAGNFAPATIVRLSVHSRSGFTYSDSQVRDRLRGKKAPSTATRRIHVPQAYAFASTSHPKYKLLAGLAPRDQELVLGTARVQNFPAGSVITTQGNPAERLYLLLSGCVRFFYTVPDGRKFALLLVAPGEAFGGAAIMPADSEYLMSCETVKDSKVLSWDRATVRRLADKYPKILHNALTIAGEYVTWYLSAHIALGTHSARERLAGVLLDLARATGVKTSDGVEIEVTNEDLADAANISHYTTSRLMSEWHKARVIVKGRGKILLRSPARLSSRLT
jgi:CRP-like cAMP-binding protein